MDELLQTFTALSEQQCAAGPEQIRRARESEAPEVARAVESGYESLCVCLPAKVKALRARLSPSELQARDTRQGIQERYLGRLFGHCGGEQLRAQYEAGCPQLYAKSRPNSIKYCRCMHASVAKLSDSELAELGLASAEYTPQAAEAEKQGKEAPAPPPPLKRFLADERRCQAP